MKYIFSVLLLFISVFAFSQDTIIKNNGDVILVKITEINPTEIKYKKFDYQDGPVYVDNKSEIQTIKYSNGIKEEFAKEQSHLLKLDTLKTSSNSNGPPQNKIYANGPLFVLGNKVMNERRFHRMLLAKKDKDLSLLVRKAKVSKGMEFIGFAAIPSGIAAAGFAFFYMGAASGSGPYASSALSSISQEQFYSYAALALSAVTISCPIISEIYKHRKVRCNRNAIEIYNQKF